MPVINVHTHQYVAYIRVYLDNVPVEDVVEFDPEEGWIAVIHRNDKGKVLIDPFCPFEQARFIKKTGVVTMGLNVGCPVDLNKNRVITDILRAARSKPQEDIFTKTKILRLSELITRLVEICVVLSMEKGEHTAEDGKAFYNEFMNLTYEDLITRASEILAQEKTSWLEETKDSRNLVKPATITLPANLLTGSKKTGH